MTAEEELEEYWEVLHPRSLIHVIEDRPSDLSTTLDVICEKTLYDLKNALRHYLPADQTEASEAHHILERGVRGLKANWLKELRGKNLAGLVEFILQGQDDDLTPAEMYAFLRALPRSFLTKICASTLHTANGIHALMGVEVARRERIIASYTLERTGGRIRVTFSPRSNEDVLQFYLDESFELIEDRLQSLNGPPIDEPPF